MRKSQSRRNIFVSTASIQGRFHDSTWNALPSSSQPDFYSWDFAQRLEAPRKARIGSEAHFCRCSERMEMGRWCTNGYATTRKKLKFTRRSAALDRWSLHLEGIYCDSSLLNSHSTAQNDQLNELRNCLHRGVGVSMCIIMWRKPNGKCLHVMWKHCRLGADRKIVLELFETLVGDIPSGDRIAL